MDAKEQYLEYLKRPEWFFYRKAVLDAFGEKCMHCGSVHRLQIHHVRYHAGLKPWEYTDPHDIMVLCRWCHLKEHERIDEDAIKNDLVPVGVYALDVMDGIPN